MSKRIKIRNHFWRLEFWPILNGNDRGSCDAPTKKAKAIKIRSTLKGQERLEILIHEMLHAAFWDLDEEPIEETAADIARALHGLGYKLRDD